MILLVSHGRDEHLAPVRAELRRLGARSALLDLSRYPAGGRVTLQLGAGRFRARLDTEDGPVRAEDIAAVWWRRPQALVADPAMARESHRRFAVRETSATLAGLWQSLPVRWVNHPLRSRAAERKPWQLWQAERAGLAVPRTCITNDPAAARAFLGELAPAPVIYKGLTASPELWRETRRVGAAERRLLALLRHAPVIFQEQVPGTDLRVTAVGGELFAAEIDAGGSAYPDDFRVDPAAARVRAARLPAAVGRGLRRLLGALGLDYAAVDLRRTPRGEVLFLEVNPGGQWLFVEERTGQPIARQLARTLALGSRPGAGI